MKLYTFGPSRRFPMFCPVTYHAGLLESQGSVWNVSLNGWRMSGALPLRVGQTIPLTVTLSEKQSMFIAAAIVRWKRGEEFGLETLVTDKRTQSQLQQYITQLVQAETYAVTLHQVRTTL